MRDLFFNFVISENVNVLKKKIRFLKMKFFKNNYILSELFNVKDFNRLYKLFEARKTTNKTFKNANIVYSISVFPNISHIFFQKEFLKINVLKNKIQKLSYIREFHSLYFNFFSKK